MSDTVKRTLSAAQNAAMGRPLTEQEREQAKSAEYVLGLLSGAQKAGFEEQLAKNAALQQDVAAWSEYFATLTEAIPDEAPEPALLRRITAQAYGAAGPRPPVWRQVLPYLIGGVLGGALVWAAMSAGLVQSF